MLVEMQSGTAAMANSKVVPQLIKNGITTYTSRRTECKISKKYFYTHFYCSFIHNSQQIEATGVSVNG